MNDLVSLLLEHPDAFNNVNLPCSLWTLRSLLIEDQQRSDQERAGDSSVSPSFTSGQH
jgi:hypothetical protein